MGSKKKVIWIDMDNSPHILFFRPIIRELEEKGYRVVISVRNFAQAIGMADLYGLNYTPIGRHYGKNKFMKVAGLLIRTLEMIPFALKHHPDLAVSHGSRSQIVFAFLFRIRSVMIFDYEHASDLGFIRPNHYMAPAVVLEGSALAKRADHIPYPGIKEDVYIPEFRPEPSLRQSLGVSEDTVLVTLRPPATEAHYHNPEAEKLLDTVFQMLNKSPNIMVIVLPRHNGQKGELTAQWPELFSGGKFVFPDRVLDGLNLCWNSDLVISGGGTMIREAATLKVPAYSIFRGKKGNVDAYLEKVGLLTMLGSSEEVRDKLKIRKSQRTAAMPPETRNESCKKIVDTLISLA